MFDKKTLVDFPALPGVYLMKDSKNSVLYVGKANNLRARLKQYFASPESRDERIQVPYLIEQVASIDTIIVHSEKEALLLENTLIKRHRPKYNILLKDDKTYVSLKLSHHEYPRLSLSRYKGKPPSDGDYFGPYTQATKARQMFDLVGTLFGLRQCSDEEFIRRTRPCLLYQIKRCIAPCVHVCSDTEYKANVVKAKRLLSGYDTELVADLKREMKAASDALEFEKAADFLKKIRLIESMQDKQSVEAIHAASADVMALHREGYDVIIVLLLYRESRLIDSLSFHFDNVVEDDKELIQSFLLQHYLKVDELIPSEIILEKEIPDLEMLSEIISEKRGKKVSLYSPKIGEKKKLVELAKINAEALFSQKKDQSQKREKLLLDIQEKLFLTRYPRRIECFDTSHLAGTEMVSSQVVFIDGYKYRAGYRKYRIRTANKSDDYGALREVLTRRFSKVDKENELPDLLIIDGGKGHYTIAMEVLAEHDIISCDVIAVAKEEGRHDKGLTQEKVICPGQSTPLILDRTSPILQFLQTIRDEAHRTAITFQKVRRSKEMIKSALDAVPGVGPVKKKRLLQAFGSVQAIKEASIEELHKVQGITKKDAETILRHLHTQTT